MCLLFYDLCIHCLQDMIFGVGDGSQFAVIDTGFLDDGCFDATKGKGQGQFRAIRDDFMQGKVRRIPYALLDSPTPLTDDQVSFCNYPFCYVSAL